MRNVNLKKLLFAALAVFVCQWAFSLENATLRIKKRDGSVVEKSVRMEKAGDALRVCVPVREISRDIKFIDIIADDASAKKGEAGFFVLGDSSYGEFRYDDGFYMPSYCHMPIFGMKTPRGAFVAIVKGLRFEQTPAVEAVGGRYRVFPRFFIRDDDCNSRGKIYRSIGFNPYEDIVVDFILSPKTKAGMWTWQKSTATTGFPAEM